MNEPTCDAVRPQLGELLLGALAESDALLEHVADCEACAKELVALQDLEHALSAQPPAAAPQPRKAATWVVAYVVAACAALALGAFARGLFASPPPPARVLDGSGRTLEARATPGAALERGRIVAGREGLTLRLDDGSVIRADPGTALTLTHTRALRLHRGRARFSVVTDPIRPFRVETPRAPVRVLGTVFDVHVEEVVVAGTGIKAAGLAVVVGVSVLTGAVVFGEDAAAVEIKAGESGLADHRGVRRVAVGAQALAQAQQAQQAAESENTALTARSAELEAEAAKLRARVADLEAQLTPEPNAAPAEPAPTEARSVFTFGDPSPERAALSKLDWETPAAAVETMLPLLKTYFDVALTGGTPDQELQVKVYKANSKLVEAYLEVRGKLPTHADGNGEYAHPAFLANLLGAYLESAGRPLNDVQRDRVDDLGRAYDAAWDQAQLGYSEQTLKTRKLYDELVLKAQFRAGLDGLLDGQQLALIGDESLRHVNGMDLFSPVLVFSATTKLLQGADAAALTTQLQAVLTSLGIDPATPGADAILNEWLASAVGQPVPKTSAWAYTLDDGLRALSAEVVAFEQLSQLQLTAEQLEALRSSGFTILPRLVTE